MTTDGVSDTLKGGAFNLSAEVVTLGDQLVPPTLTHQFVGPKGYVHGWKFVGVPSTSLDLHTDASGKLSPEREKLHDSIVQAALAGHTENQTHPVAVFLGGGPASGKSSVMRQKEPDSVEIAADDLQEHLPEYQQMVRDKNPQAASFVHNEGTLLARKLFDEATKRRMHLILDGTGNSTLEKIKRLTGKAHYAGYLTHAKYVTVDTKEAVAGPRRELRKRVEWSPPVRSGRSMRLSRESFRRRSIVDCTILRNYGTITDKLRH